MPEIDEELDAAGNDRFCAGPDLKLADGETRNILFIPQDTAEGDRHVCGSDEGVLAPASRGRSRMGILAGDDNVETPVALHAGDHADGVTTTLKD